uniref:Uncharacterized protein n=1 Tax=Molossus molossus TaxID=27622 RepID=A0A7J8HCA4_MOLMO|nr:hypothetical protein HJG59_011097 [Molossus molossus]
MSPEIGAIPQPSTRLTVTPERTQSAHTRSSGQLYRTVRKASVSAQASRRAPPGGGLPLDSPQCDPAAQTTGRPYLAPHGAACPLRAAHSRPAGRSTPLAVLGFTAAFPARPSRPRFLHPRSGQRSSLMRPDGTRKG